MANEEQLSDEDIKLEAILYVGELRKSSFEYYRDKIQACTTNDELLTLDTEYKTLLGFHEQFLNGITDADLEWHTFTIGTTNFRVKLFT